MGWFSKKDSASSAAPAPINSAEISLIEGGFHATEAARKVPVKHSATAGSSAPSAATAVNASPVFTNNSSADVAAVGGVASSSSNSTVGLAGGQYDFNHTIASTYFTQGDARTRALIYSTSNQFHRWAAYALGVAAYSFGSAMHVFGQGTALTTLTMSAAGTCFFLNAQNRQVNGPTKDIFWFECLGSWLWVAASFQQFSTIKKMKYCGYSSWSGLFCTVYYSTRYLIALQHQEE